MPARKPMNRLAAKLERPFEGGVVLPGSVSDQQIGRIADAAEYSAGQLYEIRQLLKQIAEKK